MSTVPYADFLTTVDNPFDPCDQFESWYQFDNLKGYNSCGRLARVARTSDALTDVENAIEISDAITHIIVTDPFNLYKRIRKTFGDTQE